MCVGVRVCVCVRRYSLRQSTSDKWTGAARARLHTSLTNSKHANMQRCFACMRLVQFEVSTEISVGAVYCVRLCSLSTRCCFFHPPTKVHHRFKFNGRVRMKHIQVGPSTYSLLAIF